MAGYPLPSGQSAWKYSTIPTLLGGIDTSKPGEMLGEHQASRLDGVLLKKGVLVADTGYKSFGQDIIGVPQMEYEFRRQSQTVESVLITTKTVYTYDAGNDRYRLVKGSAATTILGVAVYGAGVSVLPLTSAVGFAINDLIGINTSDGDQLQVIITNLVGAVITFGPAIPAGKTVLGGASIVRAVVLSGSTDIQVDADVVPSNDWLAFTNGVNHVQRYDGIDVVDIPGLPSGGNTVCRTLQVFNSALFLGDTTEGGTRYPWRVRRSDQADPTNWTTGTAGKDDLLDNSQPVVALRRLGPYLIAYKSESIFRGTFVGSFDITYEFARMVDSDGLLATNAIIVQETEHYLMGQKNIYKYMGDFALQSIGDAIFETTFGVDGNLNTTHASKSFAVHVYELNEFWFIYPNTYAQAPNVALRYHYKYGAWHTRSFGHQFYGFGLFLNREVITWADLKGSWKQQTWKWGSQVVVDQSFTVHLMRSIGGNAGEVMEYDYVAVIDYFSPIIHTVESKDYAVPDCELRFDMLEMEMQGSPILIQYSIDGGDSWKVLKSVDVPKLKKLRISRQFKFRKIRFRWTCNQSNFRWRWAGFSYKVESLT